MFKKKTLLRAMVAVAAIFCTSTVGSAYAQQQDFSRAYGYGGVIRAPGPVGGGNAAGNLQQRPILDVGGSFDAGGILGCAGLDISGMLENTFNVGNLGNEFKNYLQNTIATEALSLLYSQPGVSQVLDGMKAIGHARVSIQQERCNANEIFADATNRRIRDEAHSECLRDNGGRQTECEGSALESYVEAIAESRRWSGTLHDHVCGDDPEGSSLCKFLPNFAYDVGTGSGQAAQATVSEATVSYVAESAAMSCMENRGAAIEQMVAEFGYSEVQRRLASGDLAVNCGGAADSPDDTDECTEEIGGETINVTELTNAFRDQDVNELGNVNPVELVEKHSECIVSREIHPHVDLNISMLPAEEREGARRAISQNVKTRAAVNLYNALITALSEALIRSGGTESSDAENSMNPQTREFVIAQLEAFRAARDSIQTDGELSRSVADSVSRMNDRLDEIKDSSQRSASGALSGAASNAGLRSRGYSSYFGR